MSDRWEALRTALFLATPGPWTADADGFGMPAVRGPADTVAWEIARDVDAMYIAAANPSAIADLLAERDQLAAELDEARRDAERWRLVRSNTVDWCVADERYWMVDWCRGQDVTPEQLDAAVDVAMAAREGK